MSHTDIHEKHVKRDSWVKDIKKTYDPALLSDLIKKRIEFPRSTGPYIKDGELSTDIVNSFITDDDSYRNKLAPAIGLLLYKMMNDALGESHELYRGVFYIIRECRLVECKRLVEDWLRLKFNTIDDLNYLMTYRDALMAYALIQSKNKELEDWWHGIWKCSYSELWGAAFTGLRVQNPVLAATQLPLLVSRDINVMPHILVGMWADSVARKEMEICIRNGLNSKIGWAGKALNVLLDKLSEKSKTALLTDMKNLNIAN